MFLAGEHCDHETLHWVRDRFQVPCLDHWWQTGKNAHCVGFRWKLLYCVIPVTFKNLSLQLRFCSVRCFRNWFAHHWHLRWTRQWTLSWRRSCWKANSWFWRSVILLVIDDILWYSAVVTDVNMWRCCDLRVVPYCSACASQWHDEMCPRWTWQHLRQVSRSLLYRIWVSLDCGSCSLGFPYSIL